MPVGGKLKLKGSTSQLKAKKSKKKKKSTEQRHEKRKTVSTEDDDSIIQLNDETDAQKKHKKFKAKREANELEVLASKTYREQVEDYNQYLDNLTEHHDVPRVSAAGNG